MLRSNLLRGELVWLTAVTKEDIPTLARWWADADFLRVYDSVPAYPKNEAQLAKRIEGGQNDSTNFLFGVRPAGEEQLIGLLELDGIQWSHGTTFMSIAIGDVANRGKGYGREAMKLALRFAFDELNLHRVCLTIFGRRSSKW